jgi:hypothetical protein
MRVPLEVMHKLTLAQRNLQVAQTALDSAWEFLGNVMSEVQLDERGLGREQVTLDTQPQLEAPREQEPPRRSIPPKRGRPKKADGGNGATTGLRVLIREYLKSHSGDFRAHDVHRWLAQKGHAFRLKQVQDNLGGMMQEGKKKGASEIVRGEVGTYRRNEAA